MYKFTCSTLSITALGRHLGLIFVLIFGLHFQLTAQLEVNRGQNAQQLIESLFGDGVFVSNLQVFGDTSLAIGSFDGTGSNIGLGSGVILSTGDVAQAENPGIFTANGFKAETDLPSPGWPELTNLVGIATQDAIVFEFLLGGLAVSPFKLSFASYLFLQILKDVTTLLIWPER